MILQNKYDRSKEPMRLETWITKFLYVLYEFMKNPLEQSQEFWLLISAMPWFVRPRLAADSCGALYLHPSPGSWTDWSPRSFLICPFCDRSGPLHCYVQLTLIVKSVGRRGGEKGQARGIKLDALLRVGPGFCTACVHLSSPCLGAPNRGASSRFFWRQISLTFLSLIPF